MDPETLCPTCHQPILAEYYFCPNCGIKLRQLPLSTDMAAQLKVYAHSIILPFLLFLTIGKWQGMHYLTSEDVRSRRIGIAACVLLALSTFFVAWYTISLTQSLKQSLTAGMNSDLGGY